MKNDATMPGYRMQACATCSIGATITITKDTMSADERETGGCHVHYDTAHKVP